MAKQWTELEKLTIPVGEKVSNTTSLHPKTGTVATITVYVPVGPDFEVRVSADGEHFMPFIYKGQVVRFPFPAAYDMPLPACKAMRIEAAVEVTEETVFQILALLEVD
jgi:hypothetical protein